MSQNNFINKTFSKTVIFKFDQKPSLVSTSRKSEKAISKPNQSKNTKEQLKIENGNNYKVNFKNPPYTS